MATLVGKLDALHDRFQGLERQVDSDIKAWRDAEDSTVDAMKDAVRRLEQTMDSEVSRRQEAHKSLQSSFEAQVATVQDKLQAVFLDRFEQVATAIDSLGDRMSDVEKEFSQSRDRYIKESQDSAALAKQALANLQNNFVQDVDARKERERIVHMKVDDLQANTAEKTKQELQIYEQRFHRFQADMQESHRVREVAHGRFQETTMTELEAVKQGAVKEAKVRAQADDDIVNALNQYTGQMQEAMRSVSLHHLDMTGFHKGASFTSG